MANYFSAAIAESKLEDFDTILPNVGDPVLAEKKLYELLPKADQLSNKSIYLQN